MEITRHTGSLLLLLGLALQGAKTPESFLVWGTAVVALCVWTAWSRPTALARAWTPLMGILCAWTLLTQWTSLNSAQSLFPTLKILIFIWAWAALKANPIDVTQDRRVWPLLSAVGVISVGWLAYQTTLPSGVFRENHLYGLLPLNPTFHAIWMASLAVALGTRSLYTKRLSERWMTGASAALLVAMVVAHPARVRGAVLALAVGVVYVAGIRFTFKKVLAGLFILGTTAFLLIPTRVWESRLRLDHPVTEQNYRVQIWKLAVKSAFDRPLTGYGLGNFELGYQKFAFPVNEDFVRYGRTTQFAHNEYLQVAADMGLPGLILLGLMLWTLIHCSTRLRPEWQRPAKAALLTLGIDAFFNPLGHVPFLLYSILFWGGMLLVPTLPVPVESTQPKIVMRLRSMGLFLFLISLQALLIYSATRAVWARDLAWDRILWWNARDAIAWQGRGFQQSDGPSAVQAFHRAVQLSPQDPYLRESLANTLEQSPHSSDHERAMREYQTALALAPGRAIDALAIGRLLYRQGDVRGALPWFEKARQLEPLYWQAHLWLARSRFDGGERQRAYLLLRQIPQEHQRLLERKEREFRNVIYRPSAYEQRILAYDGQAIQDELQRFRSTR